MRYAKGHANRATRHVESLTQKLKELMAQFQKEKEELLRIIKEEKSKNKQLQGTLEQTEDAAKYAVQQILQRLRVSEMRTGELEKRFSSISRPSTALLDAISHLDIGFMRQPLPGLDQLEILEEKNTQSNVQLRPQKAMNRVDLRNQTRAYGYVHILEEIRLFWSPASQL